LNSNLVLSCNGFIGKTSIHGCYATGTNGYLKSKDYEKPNQTFDDVIRGRVQGENRRRLYDETHRIVEEDVFIPILEISVRRPKRRPGGGTPWAS
jgi:hypothetical protein